MCDMPLELSPSSLPSLAVLTRAVTRAAAELEELHAARRALSELADHWQGGHRSHYEDTLAVLVRRSAHLHESLAAGCLLLRRAEDDAAAVQTTARAAGVSPAVASSPAVEAGTGEGAAR